MNWLTEKLNPTIIGLFLIGLLVGGLAIGIVDTKRPTPLFSSADGGATIVEQCIPQVEALEEFVSNIPDPIPQVYYQYYLHQTGALASMAQDCNNQVMDVFISDWQSRLESWQEYYREVSDQRDVAYSYLHSVEAEAQQAHDNYELRCSTTSGDDRAQKSVKNLDSSSRTTSAAGTNNLSDECQDLWDAYLALQAEAEQAQQEAEEADAEVQLVYAEYQELVNERDNFEDDHYYTWEHIIEVEYSRFSQSPTSYYYDHDGRAAY